LEKWQAGGNQNHNLNIQKISTEIMDEGLKLEVVTRVGTKIWRDANNRGK
jgi:hypothetical protein